VQPFHRLMFVHELQQLMIDAINSQLFCTDIEARASVAKGKITLWGEIDRQNVLVLGKPAAVRRAVQRVWDAFGGSGGLFAQ
jgi:uroporphyrinogen decarboxylase